MPIKKISAELIDEICGSFRSLSVLNLARNEISRIENLDRLASNLNKLDLSRNALESTASGLEALTQLGHLDLSGNHLAGLAGLEHLVSLEVLHASDNRIDDVDALRTLSYLPRLHTVSLWGNPISRRAGYREAVARRLPTLRVLDGLPLNDAPPSVSASTATAVTAPPSQRATPPRGAAMAPSTPPMAPRSAPAVAAAAPSSSAAAPRHYAPPPPVPASAATPATAQPSPAATAAAAAKATPSSSSSSSLPPRALEQRMAAEHLLQAERERCASLVEAERRARREDVERLEESHREELKAREDEAMKLRREAAEAKSVAEMASEGLAETRREAEARMKEALAALEEEKATCRRLRVYVAARAKGSVVDKEEEEEAEEAEALKQQQGPMDEAAAIGTSVSPLSRMEKEEEEAEEELRAALAAATTEKGLLQMRLDAMTALQALQEDALLAGSDEAAHIRAASGAAAEEEEEEGGDGRERPRAPAARRLFGGGGNGVGEEADDGADAARALARGWRVKAYDILLAHEHEKQGTRKELEENLRALEISAAEITRCRQSERLVEARLAVCEAELSTERVARAAAADEAEKARVKLAASEAMLAEERHAAMSLKEGVMALAKAQAQAEERLTQATSTIVPLQERLAFALDRTRYLSSLQRATRISSTAAAGETTLGASAQEGTEEEVIDDEEEEEVPLSAEHPHQRQDHQRQGHLQQGHLRLEVGRLGKERQMLLEQLAERDEASANKLSAAEATWAAALDETRDEAARVAAELADEQTRRGVLEVRCAELEKACEDLGAAATAAEEAKVTHALLVSQLQAHASEQRRQLEAEGAAEVARLASDLDVARQEAAHEHAAALAASEAAATATVAAEEAAAKAEAEARTAAAEAESAARAAVEEANARERELERDAAGLRRDLAKEGVARKSLEREVQRLKSHAEEAEASLFEQLERKVDQRDQQIASLRKERNALLASLRHHQQEQLSTPRTPPPPPPPPPTAPPPPPPPRYEEATAAKTPPEAASLYEAKALYNYTRATEEIVEPRSGGERGRLSPSSGEAAPRARRRVLSAGLLDELQDLSQKLLAPPGAAAAGLYGEHQ